MKKIKALVSVVLVFMLIFMLIGCQQASNNGKQSGEEDKNTGQSSEAPDQTGDDPEKTDYDQLVIPEPIASEEISNIKDYEIFKQCSEDDELTFALLLFSRGFEWMIGLEHKFLEVCEELGVKSIVLDAQGSDETQLNQIQDMITQGVDAIILSPNSNDGLIPGVKAANDAGILLTTVEGKVTDGVIPVEVGYDNEEAGRLAAKYIAEKMNYEGAVLETRGALASLSATGRHTGFVEIMEQYPDIEVIAKNTEWVATEASKATADVFTMNPNAKAVYSNNDEMQTGIQAALSELGRLVTVDDPTHVILAGIDGTPNGLERIRQGIQDICVVQDPFEQGEIVTRNTYDFLMGKDVPKDTRIQPYIVTKATADSDQLWGNIVGTLK